MTSSQEQVAQSANTNSTERRDTQMAGPRLRCRATRDDAGLDVLACSRGQLPVGPSLLIVSVHFRRTVRQPIQINFRHACALGLEGIVSKKLTSLQVGACKSWVKVKNAAYERRTGA
jgi:hypothetical protein